MLSGACNKNSEGSQLLLRALGIFCLRDIFPIYCLRMMLLDSLVWNSDDGLREMVLYEREYVNVVSCVYCFLSVPWPLLLPAICFLFRWGEACLWFRV